MENAERFVKLVTVLARAFRVKVDELLLEAYAVGLHGIQLDELDGAITKSLRSAKFMPAPAELRGLAGHPSSESLMRPGRSRCSACDLSLSIPASLERGFCARCWAKIGGARAEAEEQKLLTTDQRSALIFDIPEEATE